MSRLGVKRGEALEKAALAQLRAWGCMVERIATPIRMVRGKPLRTTKVFADIIGLNSGGKGLLVECKNYGRIPRPSDFAPHQLATLHEWTKRGGVAMVVFILDGKLQFLPATYFNTKKPCTSAPFPSTNSPPQPTALASLPLPKKQRRAKSSCAATRPIMNN